jgi:hypothetical protein
MSLLFGPWASDAMSLLFGSQASLSRHCAMSTYSSYLPLAVLEAFPSDVPVPSSGLGAVGH